MKQEEKYFEEGIGNENNMKNRDEGLELENSEGEITERYQGNKI
jgi:hypothetical protein